MGVSGVECYTLVTGEPFYPPNIVKDNVKCRVLDYPATIDLNIMEIKIERGRREVSKEYSVKVVVETPMDAVVYLDGKEFRRVDLKRLPVAVYPPGITIEFGFCS